MFHVHFFEEKNLLLSQLLQRVPSVGEDLKIKGRKGTVSSVSGIDENKVHVQVVLEVINKKKLLVDDKKKKKK
ncbi:hypothetical protein [Alkalihalobacillus sp. AL-G]|uniref:hypothetical protein n=1 Tax=Alkalihalobacillus sp. AL-G TaxID=2926399 RepID=UPI002729A37B|nr:hypothetical protein [Alkalihalobacillus sp. AL-G]WLD94362.1 hypothetical protein MOJ78_05595 [Alkalihalobacillus sp. AL-G]